MCRLTIIVPYDRNEAAFEATLVSVLENRPEFCEVIVAHDGAYRDPFDLGDEVKFVVGPAEDPISLVKSAVASAMGRIVHVLYGGARATEGWTDEPLSMFEQSDLGCVAPVIRDLSSDGRVVAAGWRDTHRGLRQPLAAGGSQPERREIAAVQGAYLAASFWRRATLEAVSDIPSPQGTNVVDYVWSLAMQAAKWRCRVASTSTVVASPHLVWTSVSAYRAAAAMQRVRCSLGDEGAATVCGRSLLAVALNPLRMSTWMQAAGRISATLSGPSPTTELAAAIEHFAQIAGPHASQARILTMPTRQSAPLRRAA